jgi:hypothetical protein
MHQDADPSTWPEQPPDSTFTINRVGIHVPPFWPEKPAVWFMQLKGQFALLNITQDGTKFYYVISQLDNKYVVAHTTTNANISIQLTIGTDTLKMDYVIKPINLLSCI